MKPLIDADVLAYEIGFASETAWKAEGHEGVPPFDIAATLLDNRIGNICAMVGATSPPILFFTGKGNFRYAIAKRTPYKARPSNKPFHYYNLKAYMEAKYEHRISEGMEADDLMAIEQTASGESTIICTRDKDLRQVPGWHYGWELGNQASFGPELVGVDGYIRLSADRKKLKGVGGLFFLAQLLMGDAVDSVPGLGNKTGPVKAFELLDGCTTYSEGLKRVYGAYKALYGQYGYREMLEQGRLLWMTRSLRQDGSPVLWGQNVHQ